ncbi:MAG: NAD(P)/FAD-dependent oxidoreductase [Parachlamydiales bacterium]
MESVAIIGAGFAGMAACYLLSKGGYRVTLYDEGGIGAGASGVSPGLLHPYPGKFPKRKGALFAEAMALVEVAGEGAVRSRGIVRIATGAAQGLYFKRLARKSDDVESWEGGILITSGVTLNTRAYLQGLWRESERIGAQFIQMRIEEKPDADWVVYATGAATPVEALRVKGQVLELEWPQGVPPLPHSIIGRKYLVMEGDRCVVGATFEEEFDSPEPDEAFAIKELLPEAIALCPALKGAKVVGVRAGIRACLPEPALIRLGPTSWAIAGLGSKGLLNHAHLAHKLLNALSVGE